MKHLVFFVYLLCAFAYEANAQVAARSLRVAPFRMASAHGDIVCDSPAYATNPHACIRYRDFPTADLMATGTENLSTGLLQAIHNVYVSLTNVSGVPQTLDASLLPGTSADATFQSLPAPGTVTMNSNVGAGFTVPGIVLAPDQSITVIFQSVCGFLPRTCCLQGSAGAIAVGPNCQAHAGPAGNAAYGVQRNSVWNVEIKVREARGAVSGSITTQVHRHGGMKDRSQGEAIIMLNGGRPF